MARSTESSAGDRYAGSWTPTAAGAHLRGRGTQDTAPEKALRRAVHALGFRFRLHRRVGRFMPDFVLPRYRLAVFVDGCYWHNCPKHGPKQFRGPNAERWREKIATNVSRDLAADETMKAAGWRGVRVWECETRADVERAARRVVTAARAYDRADDDGAD